MASSETSKEKLLIWCMYELIKIQSLTHMKENFGHSSSTTKPGVGHNTIRKSSLTQIKIVRVFSVHGLNRPLFMR